MSIYDNTAGDFFRDGEAALMAMEDRMRHEMGFDHEMEYFDQIIEGEVDGQIKRCYFEAWKTKSCGHPNCHHPLHSIMPLRPYKIEYLPKP